MPIPEGWCNLCQMDRPCRHDYEELEQMTTRALAALRVLVVGPCTDPCADPLCEAERECQAVLCDPLAVRLLAEEGRTA